MEKQENKNIEKIINLQEINRKNKEEQEKTPHLEDLVCDCCNRSVEKLFKYDDSQYCAECILKDFEEINEDNFLEYLGE